MAISVPQIEAEFNRLNRGLNLEKITSDAEQLIQSRLVGATSQLGVTVNQAVGGFQSITAAVDDVIESVPASVPTQLVDRLAIAEMTADVPAVAQRVIQSMDTVAAGAAAEMAAITGASQDAIDNGFIEAVASSANPEAISAALGNLQTEIPLDEIRGVAEEVIDLSRPLSESFTVATQGILDDLGRSVTEQFPHAADFATNIQGTALQFSETIGQLDTALNNVVDQAATLAQPVTRQASQVFSDINSQIGLTLANSNLGFGTLANNLVDQVGGVVNQAVNSIASIDGVASTIPAARLREVRSLIDSGNFADAARRLQSFSDRPLSEIEDVLRGIDVTMAGNIETGVTSSGGASAVDTRRIGANTSLWAEADTPPEAFSLIITHEELEVELKSAQREITEIIVHWTETNINQDIGAEEIQEFAAENGLGIPYHYLIRRDGSLQRGRPIDEIGGPLINNHEQYSIQLAFVGGINVPSDIEEIDRFLSSDSLTSAQMNTFKLFLAKSYSAWPGIQALGHNEIDREQLDPGFNVTIYAKDVFQKQSVYTDLYNQQPFDRAQLIRTQPPAGRPDE